MDFSRYVREHLGPLRNAREREIVDELAQHLQDIYDEGLAAGLDHEAALVRAAAALPAHSAQLSRAIESASRSLAITPASRRRFVMIDDFGRDVRYAIRMLLHTPAFPAIVVVTMALGIGANAVIFSAIDALLLRSAPIADPHRVVSVYTNNSNGRVPYSSSSYPDYVELRNSGAFDGLAAFASISLSLDARGETLPVTGEIVSGNFFSVLGVRIATGRGFTEDEDRPGSQIRVAVVTNSGRARSRATPTRSAARFH
jgi:hypothetical protein